jgi:hypothetical protein
MWLYSEGQRGAGIWYQNNSTSTDNWSCFTRNEKITTHHFKYGIRLTNEGGTQGGVYNYHNGNHFTNIIGSGDWRFISMEKNNSKDDDFNGLVGNIFVNLMCDAENGSTRIALFCQASYSFFQNFYVWNFAGDAGKCWYLYNPGGAYPSAKRNYLACNGPQSNITDEGSQNTYLIFNDGLIKARQFLDGTP